MDPGPIVVKFAMATFVRMRSVSDIYGREITNIGWLFFDRFFRTFGNFMIGVLAARLLGPADYGAISYAQTILAFLMLIVSCGLNAVTVKQLVDRPGEASRTLGSAFALQAAATLLIGGSTILLSARTVDDTSYATLIVIVACGLVLRPSEVFRYWFEANVNARRAVIADNLAFIVSGGVKIYVLFAFRSVELLAWALVLEQILGAICLGIAYGTDRTRPARWQVDRKIAGHLVQQAWPLLLSGLAVALYMRIDQFVIMSVHGPAETGIYNAGVRISEILYVFPTIVSTTFFPRWQALIGQSREQHRLAMQSAMRVMVAIAALVALTLSLTATPIVHLLYGDQYARAATVLAIHAWTCVFVCIGILGNQWYLSHGLQSRTLLCTVLGAASNFAINLMLVPKLGAVGAAIASLMAQIISTFLADAFNRKTRELFLLKAGALFFPILLLRRGNRRPVSS